MVCLLVINLTRLESLVVVITIGNVALQGEKQIIELKRERIIVHTLHACFIIIPDSAAYTG